MTKRTTKSSQQKKPQPARTARSNRIQPTEPPAPTGKHKKTSLVKLILFIVFGAGTIVAYIFSAKIFGENSVFNQSISNNPTIDAMYQKIPALIRSIQIVVICSLVSMAVRGLMNKFLTKSKRGLTIVKLLNSFVKYLIAIIALLMVLGAWGVDTATLLASAGILGLVIGLGAQSLIADIIAGVFIVFEGEYQVGDIIVVDGWRGTVDEIGIRTTKLVDAGGNVKIINNSEIKTVINQTQELSLALCEIGIEYGESIERVENIIKTNLDNVKEMIPTIVDGPYYKGVKTLNTSSVDLLFVAQCKEEDLFQTQRDMNRALKIMFDKNKINIPFPQVVVNKPSEHNSKVSATVKKKAQNFLEDQRLKSKNLEEKAD